MKENKEDDPAEAYRVRDRRGAAVWLTDLEREETVRARPPRPTTAAPRTPAHATRPLLLAAILVVVALCGLVVEHTAPWYTFDVSPLPFPVPDPDPDRPGTRFFSDLDTSSVNGAMSLMQP